jgi:hypothetical protein
MGQGATTNHARSFLPVGFRMALVWLVLSRRALGLTFQWVHVPGWPIGRMPARYQCSRLYIGNADLWAHPLGPLRKSNAALWHIQSSRVATGPNL